MNSSVSFIVRDDGPTFAPVPTGVHTAVCIHIFDLGMQDYTFNSETKRRHEVWLQGELPDLEMDDGRPMTIGRKYNLSFNEKATLRKHLQQWRGRSFDEAETKPGYDFSTRLGKGCTLVVSHNTKGDKTYANIDAISQAPDGFVPDPFNELILYVRGASPAEVFDKLPAWAQKANRTADELEKQYAPAPKRDDIPGSDDDDSQ